MKKIISLLLALAMIFALCACAAEKPAAEEDKVEDPGKTVEEQETGNEDVPAQDPQNEPADNPEDSPESEAEKVDWRTPYTDAVTDLDASLSEDYVAKEFCLYDLDADGIPELIVRCGTCEADMTFGFYDTAEGGKAEKVGELGAGHTVLCGYAAENTVLLHYGQMGIEEVSKVVYNNGVISAEVVVEERDIGAGDYLPTEGLEFLPFSAIADAEWTGNPADNNADIVK